MISGKQKEKNIFLEQINKDALKNPLVAMVLGPKPKSPEEILKSNNIDIVK